MLRHVRYSLKLGTLDPKGQHFFQAEDGIRDVERSRGLGDVYKRQGYDERIREHLVTDEISMGDYVLTGGELPAMTMTDAIVRLIPGVLGNEQSHQDDSFSDGLLEFPQYTRPREYNGMKVPDVLLSGNHAHIDQWRHEPVSYTHLTLPTICSV